MNSFQYPLKVRRIVTAIWVTMLLFNIVEYLLAWVRSIYALLFVPLQLPFIPFLDPYQDVVRTLLTAHLGLLLAIQMARVLACLTPRIIARSDGLLILSSLGSKFIPYDSLRSVRSAELQPSGRFVVWINTTKALPLQDLAASLIFERWQWRGILLASDLEGFDSLIATIAAQLKHKYGEADFSAYFVETEPTLLLRMLNAPGKTIRQLVEEEVFPIAERTAIWMTASIVGAFLVPLFISAFIHMRFPWAAFVLVLVAIAEIPLVALYLTEMPIDSMRRIEIRDALRVYPLTQLPRWGVSVGLCLLVIAGVPFFVLVLCAAAAIIPGCYGAMKLTEEWFEVKLPESLIGLGATAIYQMIMFELLIMLMAR